MPWSSQNGGGGGGWKGGGPWGQGPSGGGQSPDLEELLKRSQDRLKQAMPGGGIGGGFLGSDPDRGDRGDRLLFLHRQRAAEPAGRRAALRQARTAP